MKRTWYELSSASKACDLGPGRGVLSKGPFGSPGTNLLAALTDPKIERKKDFLFILKTIRAPTANYMFKL